MAVNAEADMVTLGSDITTDQAAPTADSDGQPINPTAQKLVVQSYLTVGGGSATVPVDLYLRRKKDRSWVKCASHSNIDTETLPADEWVVSFDDPQPYDRVGYSISGSSGTYKAQLVAFSV